MLLDAPGLSLTEAASKELLALYGVPVTRERLAHSAVEAAAIAADIGYPVAIKAQSADLPHKTEAGVIRLGLATAGAVEQACAEIAANARRHAPAAKIDGFLVQEMAGRGLEVMIGGRVDPLFGPIVVAGLGGIFVEAIDDTVTATAPLDEADALRLLASLRHADVLDGTRGLPAADRRALAAVVIAVGDFLHEQQDVVAEVDVNPLICSGDKLVAVDALVIRKRLRDAQQETTP